MNLNQEMLTQLEETLVRYFTTDDSFEREDLHLALIELLSGVSELDGLLENLIRTLGSNPAFSELQNEDNFFLSRELRGLLGQIIYTTY